MTRAGIAPERLDGLAQPTPREEIKQRQGPGGKLLDYIDARYVMDTLDAFLGPENWQDRYEDTADGSIRCGIGVLIEGEWIWKWDVGIKSDIEPELGAVSHAFKRAAVKWGVGRDLYGHTTSGRAVAASPARPAPRPVADPPAPAAEVPAEPEYLAAAMGAPHRTTVAAVSDQVASTYGFCPDHGLAWVLQPGGISKTTGKPYDGFWKCPSDERPWCKQKPSPKWAAMHEGVA